MWSRPNLASRSEVVSIYKCPEKFRGPFPPNLGHKNIKIWTTFPATSALGTERNVASTNKNASVNLQCVPYKLTYFPWPLTQKRLRSICYLWPTLRLRRPLRCNHGHLVTALYVYSSTLISSAARIAVRESAYWGYRYGLYLACLSRCCPWLQPSKLRHL